MTNQNLQRNFDLRTQDELQHYVYALRDPRDRKIFYIGEGKGDRVFAHFNEAKDLLSIYNNELSSKVSRIHEIWREDLDVEWFIIRHGMDQHIACEVEAAVIDALEASMNGSPLNIIRGNNTPRGILTPETIKVFTAPHVVPMKNITVFVFPIQNALKSQIEINENTVYSATKGDWNIASQYRNIENSYAVGLVSGFSKGAYKIAQWREVEGGKCSFIIADEPPPKVSDVLLNKNWLNIIAAAKGFYQWGNHLVVEFNDRNEFKILRGCQNHNWTQLS